MLQGLISFCLRYRLVVLLLAVILMVAGAVAVQEAPWDVFPEFAPPQIVVQTEAPGLSTEEVENLVTIQVESALNGVSRIKTLRSSSVPGLSVVTAIFEDGTDILDARQLVGERLSQVEPQLPEGVEPPRMTPLAASTSRLVMLGLTSDTVSPMELRTLADWTFRRRLQAVQGVAHVEVFGGEVKQYQILVHPETLQQYNVSLEQVRTRRPQRHGLWWGRICGNIKPAASHPAANADRIRGRLGRGAGRRGWWSGDFAGTRYGGPDRSRR